MAQINIRVSDEELERVERVRERLQERESPLIRITQRIAILKAVEALESYLDKLDREKGRKR